MFNFSGQTVGTEIFPMRSLRFSTSYSTYLSRTKLGSNRTVWTFSFWIKNLIQLANWLPIFSAVSDSSNYSSIYINSNGAVTVTNTVGGVIKAHRVTSAVLLDPTAWYHVLISSNGSSSLNVYINGILQTSFSASTGPDASNWFFNAVSLVHYIGRDSGVYSNYNLADVIFVDGQALTPTSFTNIDSGGKLIPKNNPTSGITLGNNGFWLSFDQYDAATVAKLGYDDASGIRGSGYSGGAGNWTVNNFSTTAGVTNDSLFDVPVDYSDNLQDRGNYPTLTYMNASLNSVITFGGLRTYGVTASAWQSVSSTMGMTGGKWYAEFTVLTIGFGTVLGIIKENPASYNANGNVYLAASANGWGYISSGLKYNNAISTAYGTTFTTNDIISIIFDADNGKIYWAKNGTVQNSGDPVAGTGYAFSGFSNLDTYFFTISTYDTASFGDVNFGQKPFTQTSLWSTLKAAGYKTLCTQNIPVPSISKPSQYFDVKTWTGTGSARDITGLEFSPNFAWIKNRSATASHNLQDSVRGVSVSSFSNATDAESTTGGDITAFLSDGVSLGTSTDVNANANTYVGWFIKEGSIPGLDIITFTAPASGNCTVAHNLGVKPDFVIVKARNAVSSWACTWPNAMLVTETVYLNTTGAVSAVSNSWLNTDASNIGMLTGTIISANATHIAYAFKNVPGMSKFGIFNGTNSTNGPYVFLGFKPKFIMLKYVDASSNWILVDTIRSPRNAAGYYLIPNTDAVEPAYLALLHVLSNGFKMTTTNFNATTGRIAYVAFADKPTKYTGAF